MKTDYLLPHIFRKVGWFIFIPCSVMIMVSWLGINDWFNDDRLSFITLHIGNLSFFAPEQEGRSFFYFAQEDMFSELVYCLTFLSIYDSVFKGKSWGWICWTSPYAFISMGTESKYDFLCNLYMVLLWNGLYHVVNAINVQHISAVSLPFSLRTT